MYHDLADVFEHADDDLTAALDRVPPASSLVHCGMSLNGFIR
jgi:hypothetical protein